MMNKLSVLANEINSFLLQYSDFQLWCYGSMILLGIIFTACCAFFGGLDVLLSYQRIKLLKHQPHKLVKEVKFDWKKYNNAVLITLLNHSFLSVPTVYCFALLFNKHNPSYRDSLPSITTIIYQFLIILAFQETWFYTAHRILHWGPLFRWIHSIHHRFEAPNVWSTLYAHPIEHFVCNLFPLFFTVYLARAHIIVAWLWWSAALINVTSVHSGFNFVNPHHDQHHSMTKCNFGPLQVMDWLLATDYHSFIKKNKLKMESVD
jgi:sterol desaturase/sphingolipid hydroxylase (fatty acid hydroxylase superfamily)